MNEVKILAVSNDSYYKPDEALHEWNELRSDMEEFELDEDLKETKEDK